MEICVNEVVSVQHYSTVNTFSSVVERIEGEYLYIRVFIKIFNASMLEEDPIVLGVKRGEETFVFGYNIVEIDVDNKILCVKRDTCLPCENKRLYERFPISLYADVVLEGRRKKVLSIIKDISESGFKIYTKEELQVGQMIELNIYADNAMMFITGWVVRELKKQHHFEYGIRIKYESKSTLQSIRQYIRKIGPEHEQFLYKINEKYE